MSLEENKTVIRKMIEAINKQNLSSLDELIATDFVYHMPVQQIQGLDVMKQGIEEKREEEQSEEKAEEPHCSYRIPQSRKWIA